MSRFIVNSLTGYPVIPGSSRASSSNVPGTEWSVLDSAYAYRQVFACSTGRGIEEGRSQARAEHEAELLNAIEEGREPVVTFRCAPGLHLMTPKNSFYRVRYGVRMTLPECRECRGIQGRRRRRRAKGVAA